jgi:anti-sigma-K factor RskA
LADLAASVEPVTPSDVTRARLLANLPALEASSRPGPAQAGRSAGSLRGWLAAAAVLLLVTGGGWFAERREVDRLRTERAALVHRQAGLGGTLATTREESARLARDLAAAQAKNEQLSHDFASAQEKSERMARDLVSAQARSERLATAMAILSSPGMRPITLAALKAPPGALGHAFVDSGSRKALFLAANLPSLAPGKTYELWFIADGKPVAAGLFGVDAQGRSGTVTVDRLAPVDRIQAWAVTIEPQGGVPQPTGPMVLKG